MPKGKKITGKLTLMQTNFVREVTRTDSDRPTSFREAFMRITDTSNMKRTTVNGEASRMANKPEVRAEIERINHERERLRIRTRKSSAIAIETALWAEVNKEEVRSSDKISALRVLAGMLPADKGEEEDPSLMKKEEIIKRIEGIFKEAVGEPIEVEAAAEEDEVNNKPKHSSSVIRYSPSAQTSAVIEGFISSSDSDESQMDDDSDDAITIEASPDF